jgi:hypothetical protein
MRVTGRTVAETAEEQLWRARASKEGLEEADIALVRKVYSRGA